MNIENQIQIIDLLAEREVEFMKVRALEDAVCDLLSGAKFPFPGGQAELLSQPKAKENSKTAVSTPKFISEENAATEFLRPLHSPEENAYHIFYVDEGGQKMDSFQNDRELILDILALQNNEFQVNKIETVSFKSLEKWERLTVLFNKEEIKT